MAERKTFRLEVISPERIFYTGDAEMVELTTTEGDIGIYADHIPLTTIVAPGVMTITEPGGVLKEAAVLEGFMEITPDKVTILAQSCEWPEEIDINRAAEAKARAERRLKSADEIIHVAEAAFDGDRRDGKVCSEKERLRMCNAAQKQVLFGAVAGQLPEGV